MTLRHSRSPVPDLLYEDEQESRVHELALLLEEPELVTAATPLHRVTVFVTYRCNLACPYCKTIARSPAELAERPQKAFTHDLASFDSLLDTLGEVRHLHFTGGEAALLKELPAFVRRARERGVERLSLTSNGTLPAARYLELVGAGLDELRLSLDADRAGLGQELTLRPGAWERTCAAASELGEARRRGVPFHFILNCVVGPSNRERLAEVVAFLLQFDPDDVKLITDVDLRGGFPGAAEQLRQVQLLLGERALPLLRRKLATVFAPDAIGLTTVEPHPDWRCYIPLTERTVDRTHYYPCSVYLRENGAPLGPLTDSPEEQRLKTARFVREGDCLRDPICRRYCLHCTRAFNERANAARRPA